MNLLFSYSIDDDRRFEAEGHLFLGAGDYKHGNEVHVWLRKGCRLPEQHRQQIIKAEQTGDKQ